MEMTNKKTALVVIDVQHGMFQKATPVYHGDQLLDNIALLIKRARAAGVPVIYVQHSDTRFLSKDSPAWQLHPRLQALVPDCTVHKLQSDAFEGTDLTELLKARNIEYLVICGLVTHGCIKSSTISALERGYQITLVSDGHSSFSKDAADLIEKWNTQLSESGAHLESAAQITF